MHKIIKIIQTCRLEKNEIYIIITNVQYSIIVPVGLFLTLKISITLMRID